MNELIHPRNLANLVFEFRGVKVMIDVDLAALYETETKRLRQQVRRNQARFPVDFMFELSREEKEQLIFTSPRLVSLKHSSVNPIAFTEQGIAMLSSIFLRSVDVDHLKVQMETCQQKRQDPNQQAS